MAQQFGLGSWATPEPTLQDSGPCTFKCLVRGHPKLSVDFCQQVAPSSHSTYLFPYEHGALDFHLHTSRKLLSQSTPFFGAQMDLIFYSAHEQENAIAFVAARIQEHQHLAPQSCRIYVVGVFDSEEQVRGDDANFENFKRNFVAVTFLKIVASAEAYRNLARTIYDELDGFAGSSPAIGNDDSGDDDMPSSPGMSSSLSHDHYSPDVNSEGCLLL